MTNLEWNPITNVCTLFHNLISKLRKHAYKLHWINIHVVCSAINFDVMQMLMHRVVLFKWFMFCKTSFHVNNHYTYRKLDAPPGIVGRLLDIFKNLWVFTLALHVSNSYLIPCKRNSFLISPLFKVYNNVLCFSNQAKM